jgi:hypothetical protein
MVVVLGFSNIILWVCDMVPWTGKYQSEIYNRFSLQEESPIRLSYPGACWPIARVSFLFENGISGCLYPNLTPLVFGQWSRLVNLSVEVTYPRITLIYSHDRMGNNNKALFRARNHPRTHRGIHCFLAVPPLTVPPAWTGPQWEGEKHRWNIHKDNRATHPGIASPLDPVAVNRSFRWTWSPTPS